VEATVTPKELIARVIAELPEDATFEEAIDRIHLLREVERAEAAIRAGETLTHQQAKSRMARWLK